MLLDYAYRRVQQNNAEVIKHNVQLECREHVLLFLILVIETISGEFVSSVRRFLRFSFSPAPHRQNSTTDWLHHHKSRESYIWFRGHEGKGRGAGSGREKFERFSLSHHVSNSWTVEHIFLSRSIYDKRIHNIKMLFVWRGWSVCRNINFHF